MTFLRRRTRIIYFIHSPEHRAWHSLTSISAREKQFKDRIRVWGFDKKIKMREMKAIIRKRHFRSLQGKGSSFEVRGRPVDQAQYYTPHPLSSQSLLASASPLRRRNSINRANARYGSCHAPSRSPDACKDPSI